jgi:hypothetical protein
VILAWKEAPKQTFTTAIHQHVPQLHGPAWAVIENVPLLYKDPYTRNVAPNTFRYESTVMALLEMYREPFPFTTLRYN